MKSVQGELVSELAKPEDVPYVVEIEKNTWPSGEDMVADEEKFKIRQNLGGLVVTKDSSGQIVGYVSVFKPKWASTAALGEILHGCDDSIVGMSPWVNVDKYKSYDKSIAKLSAQYTWDVICQLYGIPHDWHEATGDGWLYEGTSSMHDPNGKVVFGVGVTTNKNHQGHGIVNQTLSKVLHLAAEGGAEYFMGFGRLPAFQATQENFMGEILLDEYINYCRLDFRPEKMGFNDAYGLGFSVEPYDYGFRFHWKLGAQPVQTKSGKIGYVVIPNAMKDDPESKNAGVLVITPIKCENGSSMPVDPYPFIKMSRALTSHKLLYEPKITRSQHLR